MKYSIYRYYTRTVWNTEIFWSPKGVNTSQLIRGHRQQTTRNNNNFSKTNFGVSNIDTSFTVVMGHLYPKSGWKPYISSYRKSLKGFFWNFAWPFTSITKQNWQYWIFWENSNCHKCVGNWSFLKTFTIASFV